MSISIAVGVDMEEVARFDGLDRQNNSSFLEKVYTERELDYCFSKTKPPQHLAARFVAKEATFKAMEQIASIKSVGMTEIEIYRKGVSGPPKLNTNRLDSTFSTLSLSHTKKWAIAVVILLHRSDD